MSTVSASLTLFVIRELLEDNYYLRAVSKIIINYYRPPYENLLFLLQQLQVSSNSRSCPGVLVSFEDANAYLLAIKADESYLFRRSNFDLYERPIELYERSNYWSMNPAKLWQDDVWLQEANFYFIMVCLRPTKLTTNAVMRARVRLQGEIWDFTLTVAQFSIAFTDQQVIVARIVDI